MALKIISYIFVLSLAFGVTTSNQVKDVPFDVNKVIGHLSQYQNESRLSNSETGEFLIDSNIVYVPAESDQAIPSIAFDGTNYLVVWLDCRSGINIYGARITQSGLVLDPAGIAISTAVNSQSYPSVAFNGFNYLVVWEDYRRGNNSDIFGARISQTGIVLDSNGFTISTARNNQLQPSLAFDGTNYLVVWDDYRSNYKYDIYGARVNQAGIILDPNGIAISTAGYDQYSTSIAFDGINYFVIWTDNRSGSYSDIYGARVSQAGIVLDPNGIVISTAGDDQYCPSLAFDGTNYLVTWQDYRSGNHSDIYCTRVNRSGEVYDTNGIAISTALNSQYFPSIVFDGTNYLIVWDDERSGYECDIYCSRLNQSGVVLDPNGIAISTARYNQYNTCIAFGGNNFLIAWEDTRIDNYFSDIYCARVNQAGILIDTNGITVSNSANKQYSPSIAFDGLNYLLVWEDYRNGDADIYGVRVNQTGAILDPNSIAISTSTDWQWSAAVSFGETNYFVVWQDDRNGNLDIYGARVSQSGIVLDPDGIIISGMVNTQQLPSVAFDGTNFLVVWQDHRNSDTTPIIYGARVSQAGIVLDPNGFVISLSLPSQYSPSLVFDGTNYLVVWSDFRIGKDNNIYGARVTQSGVVIDTNGIAISTEVNCLQLNPAIAFDGSNYLVVWVNNRSGPYTDIYGARLNLSGVVLDTQGIAISTAPNSQFLPSIAFDGCNYVVIWLDFRNGSDYDICGAKVNPSGVVVDSFPVVMQWGNQTTPKFVHGSENQMLITYSGWAGAINNKTYNTMRIWGKFYPFVGIAEENSKVKMQSAKLLEVYPNPARSFLAVRLPFSADRQTLKIFDVAGKMIKEIEILRGVYPASFEKRDCFASARNDKRCGAQNDGVSDTKISLKRINPGIYFLRVGKETKKFIVAK